MNEIESKVDGVLSELKKLGFGRALKSGRIGSRQAPVSVAAQVKDSASSKTTAPEPFGQVAENVFVQSDGVIESIDISDLPTSPGPASMLAALPSAPTNTIAPSKTEPAPEAEYEAIAVSSGMSDEQIVKVVGESMSQFRQVLEMSEEAILYIRSLQERTRNLQQRMSNLVQELGLDHDDV